MRKTAQNNAKSKDNHTCTAYFNKYTPKKNGAYAYSHFPGIYEQNQQLRICTKIYEKIYESTKMNKKTKNARI